MPRTPLHTLRWSDDQGHYELSIQGQVVRRFSPGDEAAWQTWLGEVSSLVFHSPQGRLHVYQEVRPRGGRYWYAYLNDRGDLRKRYLGQNAQVSLARLEETVQALSSASPPASLAASPPQPEREPPLLVLATKLAPPRLPRSLVERPRLLSLLDAALFTRLSLLSASAGWGKTTLLSAWAQRQKTPVAWLSLEDLDNSPTHFWVGLIAALRGAGRYGSRLGESALALLHSPQPPPLSALLTPLLQDLERAEASPAPLVLVLDDYQVISDATIHESLTFWVEHLPAHLHLLLASRVDPDLPLARWRARGQLSEIRMDELHFSHEEASHYLGQMLSAPLAAEEVQRLVSRTEGWIAGLQLAALALQKRTDRAAFLQALTGSQRYLLDYVQEDILARLPTEMRDFLLQTAVLSRLDAEVCQAVTAAPERRASQQMLVSLERANLFLVPLDEERHSYRLHDLFREALLACLAAQEPALVPELHLRAARWYEAVGELQEAIAHALAAPDFPYAARLMERAAPRCWVRGEAQMVQTWMVALPDAVLWQHASLALQATRHLLDSLFAATTEASYTRTQALVHPILARLEALLQQHQTGTGHPEPVPAPQEGLLVIERRLRLLRALLETRGILRRGDQARLAQLAREVEVLAQGEELSWQMIALNIKYWLIDGFQREGALLLPRLLAAREQAEREGALLSSLRVRSWLAQAYLRARQWPQVEQESLAGLALIDQSGVRYPSEGYLQYSLAEAYYAWNRLDEAEKAIQEELRVGQDWQQVDLLLISQLAVARLALARGELSAADQALSQAEDLIQRSPVASHASAVRAFRVSYWLAAGELEAACHWAAQALFSPESFDPNDQWAVRMVVRVHLAEHQHRQALEVLERFHASMNRPGDSYSAIEWLVLSVVALHQAGEREQALEATTRLLALTEPAGDLRLYLDLGEPMRQALLAWRIAPSEQHEVAPSTTVYVSRLLAAFDEVPHGARRSLDAATPAAPALDKPPAPASATLLVSLTPREHEVLRLLAEGASNQEIAQRLVISLETVKKHVRNLLSKLGASNRTQAVAQARARALL